MVLLSDEKRPVSPLQSLRSNPVYVPIVLAVLGKLVSAPGDGTSRECVAERADRPRFNFGADRLWSANWEGRSVTPDSALGGTPLEPRTVVLPER